MTEPRSPEPTDVDRRRLIETALDTTMLAEAAAGTGKTTSLIGRMVALLREGKCPIGTIYTLVEGFLLQAEYQVAVFCVHRHNRAELTSPREAVDQCLVVAHDRVLVGHEVLEAVDAMLLNKRFHVGVHGIIPPRNGNVERIIRNRFLGPPAPLLVRLHDVLLWVRDDEIYNHRRTAGEAGGGTGFEVFAGNSAHERQLHMRVWVDAARHNVLAAGIYGQSPFRCIESFAHSDNHAVLAKHIGPE